MEWIRDNIWQCVEVIFGAVTIIVTIIIYLRQRKQKKITYEAILRSDLVNVEDEVISKIQILYDKKSIDNIFLFIVKIINSGTVPIVRSDFETPINIEFAEKGKVLEADVINVSPKNLAVDIKNSKSGVSIQPLLLNPGDSITVKILLTNYTDAVISGRIAGVRETLDPDYYSPPIPIEDYLFSITLVLMTIFMFSLIYQLLSELLGPFEFDLLLWIADEGAVIPIALVCAIWGVYFIRMEIMRKWRL